MNGLEAVLQARALLEDVTPLRTDCGRRCGAACCSADEDGQGGMLLFPGEEKLYEGVEGFTLLQDDGVLPGAWLLSCDGACDRALRPLSCRIFPLLPTRTGTKLDRRGWAVCPLMACGKSGLSAAFVEAVFQAGQLLYAVPEHARLLEAIHQYNEALKSF